MKRIVVSALLLCLILTELPLNIAADPNVSAVTESSSSASDSPTSTGSSVQTTSPDSTEAPTTTTDPEAPEPAPPATEEPDAPITEETPSEEERLFSALYDAFAAADAEYLYFSPTEPEDALLAAVCSRLLDKVPEFFYLDAISIESTSFTAPDENGNLYRCRFIPEYTLTKDELQTARQFITDQVDAILADMPAIVSPIEQSLYLHDYICTNFAYDADPTTSAQDIYRFLQNGKGNCQGYTKLYAYLLNELGIENEFVSSMEMNHMWNLVKLDGEWYHADLTWDDPMEDQAGRALHKNFLRSDSGIAETAHHDYSAPYPCTSTRFDNSPLPDLIGAVVYLNRIAYGISSQERTIVRLDLQNLSSTPVADLSNLRWSVWETPESLWKEQYVNLYSDGNLLYFNGPSSIWSFDPTVGETLLLFNYTLGDGYLYSLRGTGHELTCTVSKAPGAALTNAQFTTAHIYESEGGGFLTTEYCLICGNAQGFVTPSDTLVACISTRASSETTHDLRLAILADMTVPEVSAPLTVKFSLYSGTDEQSVICTLSVEDHGKFLVYERIVADGLNYSVADDYSIFGLIVNGIANDSYDRVEVAITCEDSVIYRAALTADEIFHPTLPAETEIASS